LEEQGKDLSEGLGLNLRSLKIDVDTMIYCGFSVVRMCFEGLGYALRT
jgi:hypothetical protein